MKLLAFWCFLFLGIGCKAQPSAKSSSEAYKDTAVIRFFKRERGWIASDGGFSIPLNNGKVLWLFGDSHINDFDTATGTVPCLFQVRNAAMLQPENDWQWKHTNTLIGNGPGFKSFFKNKPDDNYWFWPGAGFQLKDTIYVFLSNLKKTGNGIWDWGRGGPDMWGKITVRDMKIVAYTPLQDFDSISFGQGFVKDEKAGYIYAFGSKLRLITGAVYVARFPINDPNKAWQFWDGKGWVPDAKNAAEIAEGASNSLHVSKVNGKYVLLSSEFSVGCDQGKKIYAAVSDQPTGPFSKRKIIYSIDDTLQGHYPFFYAVIAHPEYINENKELLITYSINGYGDCVNTCIRGRMDPGHYRPRGIRVPLDLLLSE